MDQQPTLSYAATSSGSTDSDYGRLPPSRRLYVTTPRTAKDSRTEHIVTSALRSVYSPGTSHRGGIVDRVPSAAFSSSTRKGPQLPSADPQFVYQVSAVSPTTAVSSEPSERQVESIVQSLWRTTSPIRESRGHFHRHHHPTSENRVWSDVMLAVDGGRSSSADALVNANKFAASPVRDDPHMVPERILQSVFGNLRQSSPPQSSSSHRPAAQQHYPSSSPPRSSTTQYVARHNHFSDIDSLPTATTVQQEEHRPPHHRGDHFDPFGTSPIPTTANHRSPPSVGVTHRSREPTALTLAQERLKAEQRATIESEERTTLSLAQERLKEEQRATAEAEERTALLEIERKIEEERRKRTLLEERAHQKSLEASQQQVWSKNQLSSFTPSRASLRQDTSRVRPSEANGQAESVAHDFSVTSTRTPLGRGRVSVGAPMTSPRSSAYSSSLSRSISSASPPFLGSSFLTPRRHIFVSLGDAVETEAMDRAMLREDELVDREFLLDLHRTCRDAIEAPEHLLQRLL